LGTSRPTQINNKKKKMADDEDLGGRMRFLTSIRAGL
jgi:hypothetical protein